MDMEKDKQELDTVSPEDLEKINKHTLKELTSDDVFTFKIRLCDNEVDRVGDRITPKGLEEIASKITGLTGLQDHDWTSEKQMARLYDAEVVDGEGVNALGEPVKYVLGKAYTLRKYKDYIDKINAGLLKEISISFQSEGDTCGICGKTTHKKCSDIAVCEDGHEANKEYNGKLCYNNIDNIVDVLEWSMVAVPCQREAGIKEKSIGGKVMKTAQFFIRQFMNSKAYTAAPEEDKKKLEKAVEEEEDKELSDAEIQGLLDENEALKAKVAELEEKLEGLAGEQRKEKMEAAVDKAFDDSGLMFPEMKELLKKEIPWDSLKLTDGGVEGVEEVMEDFKNRFSKIFGGCGASKSEEEEETEMKSKSVRKNGITFGVSSKSLEVKPKGHSEVKKPGIYF